ncbi:MAG: hypothetical protein IPN75_17800 [Dechloromonas sp.]|uniref:Uncharacterized protein n=1 Tax=Candidatus Dechloromonas phosphorivorans TaxID=2899244 RepID=A0A9D7LU26_9RHOO|nr:hypothetical protein [Candidatus Dechloromonas phosphorivorans]
MPPTYSRARRTDGQRGDAAVQGHHRTLVADPRFADLRTASEAGKGPEEPGGLNIEGLAATPDKELLIGFRNPLSSNRVASRRKALLVPPQEPG